jgi:hypothetical protein
MRIKLNFLLLITATLACLSTTDAQNFTVGNSAATPRYSIREDTPGSTIKSKMIHGSRVPFEKRYEELTAEQKQIVKGQYEQMAEEDEPPYPLYGLGPTYKTISAGQQKLLVSGEFYLQLQIDEKGEPESAKVLKSPSKETTQFVASTLMLTKFKPAKCSGAPCKMSYPFYMNFKVD